MRKKIHISLYNKAPVFVIESVFMAVIAALFFTTVWFWDETPLALHILAPICLAVMPICIILSALYGMYIDADGTVRLFFLFRCRVYRPDSAQKIILKFTEFENGRYYAGVSVEEGDEVVYYYDYSWQFYGRVRKRFAVKIYTFSKEKAEAIGRQLSGTNVEVIFPQNVNGAADESIPSPESRAGEPLDD